MSNEINTDNSIEEFLGWGASDSRLRYTPEDGSQARYSSWEEFIDPSSPWAKYFETPAVSFGRLTDGDKSGNNWTRNLRAWETRSETLRKRRLQAIEGSDIVVCNVAADRSPLTDIDEFNFKSLRRHGVGIKLGDLLATLNPDHETTLKIVNSSRLAPNGGIQQISDLLGKPIFATNNKNFEHEYRPRMVHKFEKIA